MQRVLARSVIADDGVEYSEGTPIERLPESNRDSLVSTGWTKSLAADPEPESEESEPGNEPASDQTPEAAESGATEDTESPAGPVDSPVDDSPAITTLGLSDEITSLLTAAGVLTVTQAKQYRETNGSFRTIKGIGKVSDGLINSLLDQ